MCLLSFCHCIFVEIALNFVDHFDLLALVVKSNCVWVCRAEEDVEDFKGVSVEAVALYLAFPVQVSVFQSFFTIAVVCFSQ